MATRSLFGKKKKKKKLNCFLCLYFSINRWESQYFYKLWNQSLIELNWIKLKCIYWLASVECVNPTQWSLSPQLQSVFVLRSKIKCCCWPPELPCYPKLKVPLEWLIHPAVCVYMCVRSQLPFYADECLWRFGSRGCPVSLEHKEWTADLKTDKNTDRDKDTCKQSAC